MNHELCEEWWSKQDISWAWLGEYHSEKLCSMSWLIRQIQHGALWWSTPPLWLHARASSTHLCKVGSAQMVAQIQRDQGSGIPEELLQTFSGFLAFSVVTHSARNIARNSSELAMREWIFSAWQTNCESSGRKYSVEMVDCSLFLDWQSSRLWSGNLI